MVAVSVKCARVKLASVIHRVAWRRRHAVAIRHAFATKLAVAKQGVTALIAFVHSVQARIDH